MTTGAICDNHVFYTAEWSAVVMERTILNLVLLILVWICAVDGQTCRPNAPRRDCGKRLSP